MRMCVYVCVRYHTSIQLCMHVLCGCPPGVQRVLVELLQLSKITTTAFSTCTSAEVLSTTSSLTFRVVYTPAAEHFIDQRVMTVAHPQNRGSSGVSGSDSERASDASEVSEPFMLSLQRLLNVAAGAVAANNHFICCYS